MDSIFNRHPVRNSYNTRAGPHTLLLDALLPGQALFAFDLDWSCISLPGLVLHVLAWAGYPYPYFGRSRTFLSRLALSHDFLLLFVFLSILL